MATPTGIKQIGKPGGLVEPGIQKYGVWDWIQKGVDAYQQYKPLVDTAIGLGKGYLDYKSQKEINELSEEAYNQYMREKQAASEEAQAAVDLNLTPMEITNIPTTKADVSSFTAVAARGGLMNLPTRQRKRYAIGTEQEDIEIMEPESLGDFELQKEEGVNIGPMAAFPDTGNPMSNAQQVWESGQIDQGIYQMDFNIFFQSGDWMDYISKEEVQGDTQMASGPDLSDSRNELAIQLFGKELHLLTEEEMNMLNDEADRLTSKFMATGGIAGLKHGGRIGYAGGGNGYKDYLKDLKDGIISPDTTFNEWLDDNAPDPDHDKIYAQGGRIKRDNGGIMNLGGLEKDYRTTGGFVPIGAYERKDDVPARLSKNEFVMTADAVRAAGGGSINKGAQRMYDTMKHLEARPEAKRMTA